MTRIPEEIIKNSEKPKLIELFNRKGFILEDKAYTILNQITVNEIKRSINQNSDESISLLQIWKTLEHENQRIEIDLLYSRGMFDFLIECKRTEYTWFFPCAQERHNALNIIYDCSQGVNVKTIHQLPSNLQTSWTNLSIMINDNNEIEMNNRCVPKTSYKDVHDAVLQVLKNTEAYLNEGRHINRIIIPVICTNAKLIKINYSKATINQLGDIEDIGNLTELPYVPYNFSGILKWDNNKQKVGKDHNIKTVWIVNINHLKEFILNSFQFSIEEEIKEKIRLG